MADNPGTTTTEEAGQTPLAFHFGNLFWMASTQYDTLVRTLAEVVQNGIDVNASEILLCIDLKGGSVFVGDNGDGATREEFNEALQSIALSGKGRGKLGQFGIGLVAPASNCYRQTFTSQKAGQNDVYSWEFIGEEIRVQRDGHAIPYRRVPGLPDIPTVFRKHVPAGIGKEFRTVVQMERLHATVLNDLAIDDLVEEIRESFGSAMAETHTTVYIIVRDDQGAFHQAQVDPRTFEGEPLGEVRYESAECGTVIFNLYRTRSNGGVRSGKISVQQYDEDEARKVEAQGGKYLPFSIPWKKFRMQAMGLRWHDALHEAIAALDSGVFEGVIKLQRVPLDARRERFEHSNELLAAYLIIQEWFENHGRQYVDTERESAEKQRYENLAIKTLNRLEELLRSTGKFGRLGASLQGLFQKEERSDPEPKEKAPRGPRQKGTTEKKEPSTPRKRVAAVSPQPEPGQPGADLPRFVYEILPHSHLLWEYDPERSILIFNVRHPLWVAVDEVNGKHTPTTDRQVLRLQMHVAVKLLLILARRLDPDEFERACAEIHNELPFLVPTFTIN